MATLTWRLQVIEEDDEPIFVEETPATNPRNPKRKQEEEEVVAEAKRAK